MLPLALDVCPQNACDRGASLCANEHSKKTVDPILPSTGQPKAVLCAFAYRNKGKSQPTLALIGVDTATCGVEHPFGPSHLPFFYKGNIMKYSLILVAVAALGLSACQKPAETPAAPPATVIEVPVAVPGPAGEPGQPGAEGMPGATGAAGTAGETGASGKPGEEGKAGETIIVVPEGK
jgi:hypothetical protein